MPHLFLVNPVHSIDDLLNTTLNDLINFQGGKVYNDRTESEITECMGYTINLTNPVDRIITNPARKNNLVAQIAETLWVMMGSTNIKYIEPFLPRASDFSDDGEHWRAGYGRIASMNYTPPEGFFIKKEEDGMEQFFPEVYTKQTAISQLANVIDILKKDPSSRQAYMVIPLPGDNAVDNDTVDTPCTLGVQLIIRDNKLHWFTSMRSNDVIWGLTGINVFEWTFMQEIIASILGVEVGTYTHTAGSMHIYERHYDVAQLIMSSHDKEREFDPERQLYLDVSSLEELRSMLTLYRLIFDSILSGISPSSALKASIIVSLRNFITLGNNLNLYAAIPLCQLAFKKELLTSEEILSDILTEKVFKKGSYLYDGLAKAGKFFLGGVLNSKTIIK